MWKVTRLVGTTAEEALRRAAATPSDKNKKFRTCALDRYYHPECYESTKKARTEFLRKTSSVTYTLPCLSVINCFLRIKISFINRYRLVTSSKLGNDIIGSRDPLYSYVLGSWYKWDEVGMDIPFASSAVWIVQYLLFYSQNKFCFL